MASDDRSPREREVPARGRLLKEAEAAQRLGTTPGTLNVARARGVGAYADLSYVKIGASVKYLETDIDAYIQAHRVVAGEREGK